MTNKVHALFYCRPAGLGFGFGAEQLKGLFETRELAEKRLLEEVLGGGMIASARIDELTIEQAYDEKNPLNYPDVIGELILGRKIQAIKNLRMKVDGLGLREAKDAVEAVDLLNLPTDVRAKAQGIVDKGEAERKERADRERRLAEEQEQARRDRAWQNVPATGQPFEPTLDWMYYTWLKDRDGDWWGHVGEGLYIMLNCYGERDHSGAPQPEDEIDDRHVIVGRQDERPEFEDRGDFF